MAGDSLKAILATLFIFAIVLSPVITSADAGRLNHRALARGSRPICPACVCCSPPPPGSCCRCCASPVQTQSKAGSP